MGYSFGVLDSIRMNASEEYQNRIPAATQETIATIGIAFDTYNNLYNEFCDALLNKIGKTIIEKKLFQNKLARFKSGTITTQQDVEEIFIEMAKSEGAYDPNGTNPLGRRDNPDVKVIYHRMNRRDVYTISVGDIDFLRVFRSEATLDSFISGLINAVYSGASYDEWVLMKDLMDRYPDYSFAYVKPADDMAVVAKNFVKTVRKLAADMSFPSTKFNGAKVMTWSDPNNLVLFVNKDLLSEIDVEVLAKSFNMGKTDVQMEVVAMDSFADVYNLDGATDNTLGILCDKDFFRVWDTLSHMEPQRNAQGMFTNYFYHVHQILSLSRFKNAVRIAYENPDD